jgi:hypothetical protein
MARRGARSDPIRFILPDEEKTEEEASGEDVLIDRLSPVRRPGRLVLPAACQRQ